MSAIEQNEFKGCLSASQLVKVVDQRASSAEIHAARNHIARCERCAESFEAVYLARILSTSHLRISSGGVSRCPTDAVLETLVCEDTLDRGVIEDLAAHLPVCSKCAKKAFRILVERSDTCIVEKRLSKDELRFADKVISALRFLECSSITTLKTGPVRGKEQAGQEPGDKTDELDNSKRNRHTEGPGWNPGCEVHK